MVASFHGHRVDLAALRRRFTVSLKGATLAFLMQAAERLDLAPRPLKLELQEIAQLRMPCILHWDLNHFVVLKSADARGPQARAGRDVPAFHGNRARAFADGALQAPRRAAARAHPRPDGSGRRAQSFARAGLRA